ncbi:M10 family metallopeptidase [Roseomonas sp. WA12]
MTNPGIAASRLQSGTGDVGLGTSAENPWLDELTLGEPGLAHPAEEEAVVVAPAAADRADASVLYVSRTGNPDIDGLIQGARWNGQLTYSFPDSPSDYDWTSYEQYSGFSQVSLAQVQAVRYALLGGVPHAGGNSGLSGLGVSQLTNLAIAEAGTDGADIRIAQSSSPSTAYAYLPSVSANGGDIWFGTRYANTVHDYRNPILGNYAYLTTIHELGHSLGLKHAHEYGGVGGFPVTFERDSLEFTVMTYRSHVGSSTGAGYTFGQWSAPQSYMMLDIAALQTLYGADYSTNAGGTTYTWSHVTGEMFVNGVPQGAAGNGAGGSANRLFLTVWDGGGVDTYDMSNYGNSVQIDLRPGGWSVTSQEQRAELGDGVLARGTVFNAMLANNNEASLIENAIGGGSDDTIIGNNAGNILNGHYGNDWLDGLTGNDILFGGDGQDTMVAGAGHDTLDGGAGFDTVFFGRGIGAYGHEYRSGLLRITAGPGDSETILNAERLTFADGGFNLGGGPLFDAFGYAAENRDVVAAGLTPRQHYDATGWREGRDPNAVFSTSEYLAANRDVTAAGLNPLDHFAASGWREGRDPSLAFDTRLYLTDNADVRASGLNPLEHYLLFGQAEGRTIGMAIGERIDRGFDGQYYLMTNPDVARAGIDAFTHYATTGWREGRRPDAYFDTGAYLARHADVRAAGIDPLAHYMESGWREGRDPSVRFDTSQYLAQNTDVAALGLNPLQHFLQFGYYEHRQTFADTILD